MKKLVLTSLFPSIVFALELGQEKYLSISGGTWYLQWEQNDKADTAVINEPINHTFEIKNTFAKELSISGQWKYVKGSIRYITSEGDEVASQKSKADQLMAKLGLKYKDHIETTFTYTKASTSGNAYGYDTKTGNTSYIEFNTDLTILNLTFYPGWIFKKYIGFGTEYINYQLPQSFYIKDDGKVILRAVESQMEWKANFFTLELTNIHHIKNVPGINFFFFLTGGYAFNIDIKGTSAIEPSGYGNYLEGDKGYFYRGDAGLRYNFKKYIALSCGYRYSRYLLESKSSNQGLNIYARAESKFEGPYLKLHLSF